MMPLRALNIVSNILIGVGLGLGLGAAILAWPKIEARYFPVVINWSATATRERGGQTLLRIHAVKLRSCKFLDDSMSLKIGDDHVDVASAWIDDPTPGSTRHVGQQDFGTMRVFTSRATPPGTEIVGVVRHQCHAGPDTLTPIGGPGFTVPPLPAE